VSKDSAITGISLGYLNRVTVASTEFLLEDFFNILPGMPLEVELDADIGAFSTDTALHFTDPDQRLRLRFESSPKEEQRDDESGFTMRLQVGSPSSARFHAPEVLSWLDTAHSRIETVFDASFTERAHKELFGERGEPA
jgi:uncharacterized protein (TIGR04255 family)